ncbi:DNA polymerase IV [bacterium BMS3Bbin10]|nr:DNA polymerase IV [bacterium BMS3Bbin10]
MAAEPHEGPLALTHSGQGGDRLIAVNEAAGAQGLAPGLLLADARAMAPELKSLAHDADAEARGLERLARWCGRFSPWVSPDPPDGLWLDVTGTTHLFGGEAAFLETLDAALGRLRLCARLAMADTPGAAWALARFGREAMSCIPAGAQKTSLEGLPVAALRLGEAVARQLERLGLKRIGQLYDIAPLSFRSRFGREVTRRLNQALGREKEPISPMTPEPDYQASLRFPEPIGLLSDVNAVADILITRVMACLAAHGKGARGFLLTLYGATGGVFTVEVKTAALGTDGEHVKRLFQERLRVLENRFDVNFGADAFSLQVSAVERLEHRQGDIADDSSGQENIDPLIDRLRARLGRNAVARLNLRESHIPERAAYASRAEAGVKPEGRAPALAPRPLLLLPRPEAIRAIAEVPDYPPHRFEWRKVTYEVARAEGPERVSAEWWRENADGDFRTRDYFRVEAPQGARFWIFRLGLNERREAPCQWFMHGLFP